MNNHKENKQTQFPQGPFKFVLRPDKSGYDIYDGNDKIVWPETACAMLNARQLLLMGRNAQGDITVEMVALSPEEGSKLEKATTELVAYCQEMLSSCKLEDRVLEGLKNALKPLLPPRLTEAVRGNEAVGLEFSSATLKQAREEPEM